MEKRTKHRPKSRKAGEYKIKNWKQYNQALKRRGSLEIWIEDSIESQWYYKGKLQRGAQYQYSDACIKMAAVLREVYHLPYRQLEGFLQSLVKRMGWLIKVPDYTVIHKRIKKLGITMGDSIGQEKGKKYIVMDSTGLKVYGEGEWKVRQHGWGKHRTWMKVHVAIDEATAIIESCAMTTNGVDDAAMVESLLDQVQGEVNRVAADGAYDKMKVYAVLKKRKIKPIIPPRRGARIKKHGNKRSAPSARDKNIRAIRKLGRKKWKKKMNYHRRSIAESTMYRFKTIFGGKLNSRVKKQQQTEVAIKCHILNKMTKLGMPQTYAVSKTA